MNIQKHILVKNFLFVTGLVVTSLALAHGGAEGVVKARMDGMSAMGKAMKSIVKEIKSRSELDTAAIYQSSQIVVKHSSMIPKMFKEESIEGPSEALPKIWVQWDDFSALAVKTQDEAEKLGGLANEGADKKQLMKQFAAVGKTCKGCHTDYRIAKD